MMRSVTLATAPLLGTSETVVEVRQVVVSILALELSLLLEGLAQGIRITAGGTASIILTVVDGQRSKAVAQRTSDAVQFELGRNQAEYLYSTLLRAYRDGMAEVNHVHVEGALAGGEPFDFTVMFELYREPMSGEEAMRLMDD